MLDPTLQGVQDYGGGFHVRGPEEALTVLANF